MSTQRALRCSRPRVSRERSAHIQPLSFAGEEIPHDLWHTLTYPRHPAYFFQSWHRLLFHGLRTVRERPDARQAALLILAHFRHGMQAARPMHPQHSKYKLTTSAMTAMIANMRSFCTCVKHEDDLFKCCLFHRILVGCRDEYPDFFRLENL